MKEIKPTYVTWEQARLLKEKGFDESCYRTYNLRKELSPFPITENMGGEKVDPLDYKWNNSSIHPSNITAPEQWQVVEFLRVNHGIWVEVGVGNLFHKDKFYILIKEYNIDRWNLTSLTNDLHSPYDSPQEAYSAAFDYILNNNLI